MGILGLTTLIDGNLQLLQEYKLHDCEVVVDGNNLFHLLYYSYNIDFTHGGDYDKFSRKIHEFFNILKSCRIIPYIILDGGYEADDRKLKTILERASLRIAVADQIANGQNVKILPVLAYEVFIGVLDRLGVKHVTCDFEADNQIAVIANDLECPVISFDSDFYILEIANGFIPFDSVNFAVQPRVTDDSGQEYKYLPVRIYFTQNFLKCFPKLDKGVLPLMATVMGNDYISIKSLEEFYSTLNIPKHGSSNIAIPKSHRKMLKIIHWLEGLSSVESGINKLLKSAKQENGENMKKIVEKSIASYSVTSYYSFNLSDFLIGKKIPTKDSETLSFHGNKIPSWLIQLHRQGKIPVFLQNTIVLHRNILLCQVEDLNQLSSFCCSLFLRQCLYGILLKDDLSHIASTTLSKDCCIEEYHRHNEKKNLKKDLVPPLKFLQEYGDIPGLEEIEQMEVEKKREFMYKVFDIRLSNKTLFSDDVRLFLMTIVYWIKHADPKVSVTMVKSLVMCWMSLTLRFFVSKEDSLDSELKTALENSTAEQRDKICKNLEKYFIAPQHSRKHPISISIVHESAQFQTCFLTASHLNQILCLPFPSVNPAAIFNGSFIYNFCKDLQTRTAPDIFISEMLVKQSPVLVLFEGILTEIMSLVSEDCFMSQTAGKKRIRNRTKKKSTVPQNSFEDEDGEDKTSETFMVTAACELSNRFNFLEIED